MSETETAQAPSARAGIGAVLERIWRVEALRYEVLAAFLLLPVLVAGHARAIDYVLYFLLVAALFVAEMFRTLAEDLLRLIPPEGLAQATLIARGASLGTTILRACIVVLLGWVLLG
ncbi:diacylglycerol kinase [Thioclava sp. 15-R06ZXC-3]|uniref:Diacylglycerol kinase n=1 Tax=Thioclava arctica TaxID=3238301 RepID=A0ABV3TFP2_9RHOB